MVTHNPVSQSGDEHDILAFDITIMALVVVFCILCLYFFQGMYVLALFTFREYFVLKNLQMFASIFSLQVYNEMFWFCYSTIQYIFVFFKIIFKNKC